MSIPSWEGFRVRKIPTSDPAIPKEELEGGENRQAVEICKVCRQPLKDTDTVVICAHCGHYAHAEHAHTFTMSPHCTLCIIELTNVDKRAFKVLLGVSLESKEKYIKKAGKFSDDEFHAIKKHLLLLGLVEETRSLFSTKLTLTAAGDEVFPVLKDIYRAEQDVFDFEGTLLLIEPVPLLKRFRLRRPVQYVPRPVTQPPPEAPP